MTVATPIFTEGFDRYGPPGSLSAVFSASVMSQMFAGSWTSVNITSSTATIVAGLTGHGYALKLTQGSSNNGVLTRDTGTNYSRAVGGVWVNFPAYPDRLYNFVQFTDSSGNIQGGIAINSLGQICLTQNGGATIVATSAAISPASTHYVSWDFVCSDTGAFTLYLDNNVVATGTGDFKASTISSWRSVRLGIITGGSTGSATSIFDSLHICDDTGTVITSMPVVDTEFPVTDESITFTIGAGALGWWDPTTGVSNAPGANELYLRKVTCPTGGGTIAAVSAYMAATNAAAKFRAVVYADNAGTPNAQALLASASVDTVGATANTVTTSNLATPYAMTAGVSYWIGMITDTSLAVWTADAGTTGVKAASTYASGPPGTCPAVTTGQSDWCLWATITGTSTNNAELSQNPTPSFLGDFSYVTSSNVNNEDLYAFAPLAVTPSVIHCTAIKAYIRNSDAGARTVTLNTKSSGTDGTGSLAAIQPLVTYQWLESYFLTDPNTGAAWTATNLNAAWGGYKIAS